MLRNKSDYNIALYCTFATTFFFYRSSMQSSCNYFFFLFSTGILCNKSKSVEFEMAEQSGVSVNTLRIITAEKKHLARHSRANKYSCCAHLRRQITQNNTHQPCARKKPQFVVRPIKHIVFGMRYPIQTFSRSNCYSPQIFHVFVSFRHRQTQRKRTTFHSK